MFKFTDKQKAQAILEIKDGMDVMGVELAYVLRQVEKENPDCIIITKSMGEYDGADRLPYFGAIATQKGTEWATKITGGNYGI